MKIRVPDVLVSDMTASLKCIECIRRNFAKKCRNVNNNTSKHWHEVNIQKVTTLCSVQK